MHGCCTHYDTTKQREQRFFLHGSLQQAQRSIWMALWGAMTGSRRVMMKIASAGAGRAKSDSDLLSQSIGRTEIHQETCDDSKRDKYGPQTLDQPSRADDKKQKGSPAEVCFPPLVSRLRWTSFFAARSQGSLVRPRELQHGHRTLSALRCTRGMAHPSAPLHPPAGPRHLAVARRPRWSRDVDAAQ